MTNIYDIHQAETENREPEPAEPRRRSRKKDALTPTELRTGKMRLYDMVERAFETLEEAMVSADHQTAVKAALGILDRTGFGPRSTVDVNQTTVDLSSLSKEELAARAERIAGMLRTAKGVIDVTPEAGKSAMELVKKETIQ